MPIPLRSPLNCKAFELWTRCRLGGYNSCNHSDARTGFEQSGSQSLKQSMAYVHRGFDLSPFPSAITLGFEQLRWSTLPPQEPKKSDGCHRRRSPRRRLLRPLAKEMQLCGVPAQRRDLSVGNNQEGASVEGRVDGGERLAQGWRGSA